MHSCMQNIAEVVESKGLGLVLLSSLGFQERAFVFQSTQYFLMGREGRLIQIMSFWHLQSVVPFLSLLNIFLTSIKPYNSQSLSSLDFQKTLGCRMTLLIAYFLYSKRKCNLTCNLSLPKRIKE